MTQLSDVQLRVLHSLERAGWPAELLPYLHSRCGLDAAPEWAALLTGGLVKESRGRYTLTPLGRLTFNRQRKGRYF